MSSPSPGLSVHIHEMGHLEQISGSNVSCTCELSNELVKNTDSWALSGPALSGLGTPNLQVIHLHT